MTAFDIEAPIVFPAIFAQGSVLKLLDLRPKLYTIVDLAPLVLESERLEQFATVSIVLVHSVNSLDPVWWALFLLGFDDLGEIST